MVKSTDIEAKQTAFWNFYHYCMDKHTYPKVLAEHHKTIDLALLVERDHDGTVSLYIGSFSNGRYWWVEDIKTIHEGIDRLIEMTGDEF